MKVGFIGLGKLGLPTAYTMAYKGHSVYGYDINKDRYTFELDTQEYGTDGTVKTSYKDLFSSPETKNNLTFVESLEECILLSEDLIFVAIQTPHNPKYEGTLQLESVGDRTDFNYKYLINSIEQISNILDKLNVERTVIIISTVLPGTIRKYIYPVMSKKINLCYNPYFIAMGTVVRDFLYPEFILLGCVNNIATDKVIKFYESITDSKVFKTSLENAEMIKVSYNTFIGTKICLANNIMEMCEYLPGTNCDEVMDALCLSDRRLISKNYLRGGMGDGGGCHPRDNIAMSWLSNKNSISYNFYDSIMLCREKQTEFLVNTIIEHSNHSLDKEIIILGKAFKPNTNIVTGSPALLLVNILKNKKITRPLSEGLFIDELLPIKYHFDPLIDDIKEFPLLFSNPYIYFIATQHDLFTDYVFPDNSIVIDPFRYLEQKGNYKLHKIGYPNQNH